MKLAATLATLLGFAFTFGWIQFLTARAERLGMIDHPVGGRKNHLDKTPTVGGLAILLGVALSALIVGFAFEVHPAFWSCYVLVAATGAADDRLDLGPYVKFAVQIAAALVMSYWGGVSLLSLGNLVSQETLTLGRFALPLTVFAVIGVINAINFCDGADGLAGGLVLTALFWLSVMSAATANGTATLTFGLLGCLVAFLAFNLRSPWRSRAAIFLGDAGSLSLGFVLAWLTVEATQGEARAFPPVTAIWLLAIPISDTIVCMARRLLKGQSPFRADRTHLHHILIDLGMPIARAVALIHFIAFALAAVGVAGWALQVAEHVMFYSAMAVFAVYIVLVQFGLSRASAGGAVLQASPPQ